MAWEERNGRRYYYRKVRKGGRVFSVYEGGGLGGELSAQRVEAERTQKTQRARTFQQETARQDAIDAQLDQAWASVRAAVDEALETAGYHRHKRQWRLKRNGTKAG